MSGLMIAILALIVGPVLAALIPGPPGETGPPGPAGPRGPMGPRVLVANWSSDAEFRITVTQACVNYPGAILWLNTTEAGTVVVTATTTVILSRGSATLPTPVLDLFLGTSSTDCQADAYSATAVQPTGGPGGMYLLSVPLQEVFVVSAGAHAFFLNAFLVESGGNPATISRASLIGTFVSS